MKPTKLIGFILRSVIGGLAIAFIVIYLWPSIATRGENMPNQAAPPALASAAPFSYSDAVNRAAPAVVSIYTTSYSKAGIVPNKNKGLRILYIPRQHSGSGVLLSKDGYIITNNHVIDQGVNIRVELWDKRVAPAEVVGIDPETDLAVLRIALNGLPVAPLSEENSVFVGDVVLAIGNALGLSNTVTMGIVSATGRIGLDSDLYDDFIQTDAAINLGNSGGALVNAHGDLIGINTRNAPNGAENIGFAIPITLAKTVMQEIIEYGSVRRGWMGASFTDLRPMAQPDGSSARKGIGVGETDPDGPAWKAGIRRGDIILSKNGEEVDDARKFLLEIAESEPGSEVELEVFRRPETFSTYVTLIQQPPLD